MAGRLDFHFAKILLCFTLNCSCVTVPEFMYRSICHMMQSQHVMARAHSFFFWDSNNAHCKNLFSSSSFLGIKVEQFRVRSQLQPIITTQQVANATESQKGKVDVRRSGTKSTDFLSWCIWRRKIFFAFWMYPVPDLKPVCLLFERPN